MLLPGQLGVCSTLVPAAQHQSKRSHHKTKVTSARLTYGRNCDRTVVLYVSSNTSTAPNFFCRSDVYMSARRRSRSFRRLILCNFAFLRDILGVSSSRFFFFGRRFFLSVSNTKMLLPFSMGNCSRSSAESTPALSACAFCFARFLDLLRFRRLPMGLQIWYNNINWKHISISGLFSLWIMNCA